MVFTGTYEHSIDAKQRLAIPADIRSQVQRAVGVGEGEPIHFVVTLCDPQALSLYTESAFETRAAELEQSQLEAGELLAYERLLFSMAKRVELDKQGRVRLPEHLLSRTGLGSEVVLLGVKDHLELRDRAAWQQQVEQLLAKRPDMLMDPRAAMRTPGGVT